RGCAALCDARFGEVTRASRDACFAMDVRSGCAGAAFSAAASGSGTSVTAIARIAALRRPARLRKNLTVTRCASLEESASICTRYATKSVRFRPGKAQSSSIDLRLLGERSNFTDVYR